MQQQDAEDPYATPLKKIFGENTRSSGTLQSPTYQQLMDEIDGEAKHASSAAKKKRTPPQRAVSPPQDNEAYSAYHPYQGGPVVVPQYPAYQHFYADNPGPKPPERDDRPAKRKFSDYVQEVVTAGSVFAVFGVLAPRLGHWAPILTAPGAHPGLKTWVLALLTAVAVVISGLVRGFGGFFTRN